MQQQSEAWGMALDFANRHLAGSPMPCCPPGSLPKRATGAHVPKGSWEKVGEKSDLEVYISGDAKHGVGMLVNPEPLGPRAGDLQEICDFFADNGYFVVMPDWHHGNFIKDMSNVMAEFQRIGKEYPWSALEKDFVGQILPIFHKRGVKTIGAIGFCYGTWLNVHQAALGKVNAILNFHPSHTRMAERVAEKVEEVLNLIKCPVLQCAAGNDPDANKAGGSDEQLFKKNCGADNVQFKDFPEMKHGWFTRADHKVEKEMQQQSEAWALALEFAHRHLKGKKHHSHEHHHGHHHGHGEHGHAH